MRKAHVKVLPLGAIVFVLILASGVFPSMAQAVDLTINFVGSGTGRVEGSDAPGIGPFNIFSSQTINYDLVEPSSSVVLTAVPTGLGASQSTFGGWTGCASTSGTQCTVVMSANRTVTVTFNLLPVNLTVNFGGSGTGRVEGSGVPGTGPFSIFTSQTINYDLAQPPSSVVLTAVPTGLGASQSTFVNWTGCTSTSGTQCTVEMSANRTVTVTFNLIVQRTLTVTKAGTGSGTVTSTPAGISCGSDCTENYADGTTVSLTAAAATGSTFAGWSGGVCSGTSTCSVSMTAARAVTATFTSLQRTLTVTKAGTGSGTVTSVPAGIACGSDCTENYADGTAVTLTAAAATGSTFAGWSGGVCSGTSTCSVSMTAARAVTATFTSLQRTLTVTKAGTGSGTVTSVPAGIACGSDCTENYADGTAVTLTAAAATGSTFAGWSGGVCSGTSTCSVSMTAARAVTATFTSLQRTLTVTKAGTGSGTVTSVPAGIACGSDCTENYADGTAVTLTAAAATGSTFAGWSGGVCSGTSTCSVSMTAARTVTATFNQSTQNQAPSVNAGPSQTITLPNTATLTGTVTDDGLPTTPGVVTILWSKVSGPGTVIFANASAASTTASFSQAGTYVLRLTATDGALSRNSDLTITVNNPGVTKLRNDLNADGTADILWRNTQSGIVVAWLMNDAAIASTGVLAGVPMIWQIMGMGDVNADGFADVIWRNTTNGVVAVWLMDGLTITSVGFPGAASLNYVIKGIGDVDGNGTADIVWRDTLTGATAVWLMNGSTIASSGFPRGVPLEWEIAGMGDVNADGKDDVIWRNTTNGVVAVWLMDGLTVTSVGFPGAASLSYVIKQIGDMDGNGTADIVWHDTLTGAVAIWLMNGPTIAFAGFPGGVPPEWEMTGMGDVNADGMADLIWQNRASGAVALWLMNGKDVLRTTFPTGTSTDWEIQ
jgi:hypothetical protein